jgi:ABC-2 type transport system permease protein
MAAEVGLARLPAAHRALADRRRSLIGWTVAMVAYAAMILAVWPSISGSESFADLAESYPDVMKALFGGVDDFEAITTPTGFLNTYVFSFMLPLLLLVPAIAMSASILAGERERGLLDLVLSSPLSRRRLLAQKALAVLGYLTVIVVVVTALLRVLAPVVDLDVPAGGIAAAGLGSLLYALVHAGLTFAVGAATGRKAPAVGVASVVAGVGYLVNGLADLASWLRPFRVLSPLHYATEGNPVANGVPLGAYGLLVGVVAVSLVAASAVFERRDLV